MVPTRFAIAVVTAVIILAGCKYDSQPRTPLSATPVPVLTVTPAQPRLPHTLSGVVFEATASGRAAVEGVEVYCDNCGSPDGHTLVYTGGDGRYSFAWAYDGGIPLQIKKDGYSVAGASQTFPDGRGVRVAQVNGDTTFDIEIVRR